jgi:hypothetical protein
MAPRKCFLNTQFVGNILFTDETGFTREGIMKFHYTHMWVDDNPDITMMSKYQHLLSINVWVDTLGDQLLGPVFST